ncbi:unnamed protein product [Phytophthora lilii]|uniref:Unnamed protein product n=1 Tax=Phytophthora lilii TaxID=2077276 RepID=A0A9W6TT57_9STRA|nr:unnamed protein product [Phytophthora lilii]
MLLGQAGDGGLADDEQSEPKSDAELGDYRDAAWFRAADGDLVFAQWLLGRCNGVGDAVTPQSPAAAARMFALFKTQRKLRRELALGSKREAVNAEDETETEEEAAETEEPLWPVQEIVQQVGDVLRVSRRELQRQQREAEKTGKAEGAIERIVVAEVVDNATELILSRASSEHTELLRRWVDVLKEKVEMEETPEIAPEVKAETAAEMEQTDEAAAQKSKKRERKEKKMRMKKNKSKAAEDAACEQVESFLAFLAESAQIQTQAEAVVTAAPSKAEKMWTSELQRIVELSSIEPEEEARRLRVARDIQTVLRREVNKWRHCEVILFGSSLTHYGSRNSDLDMCLLPTGRKVGADRTPPEEVMGSRQLRHLMNGKVNDDEHTPNTDEETAEQLQDLRAQVQKSLEKLTQALNTMDRSGKSGDKHNKQRRQLEFFDTQMRLLRKAIVEELTKLTSNSEQRNGATRTEKFAHLKTIIAASKRRSDDLYHLQAILQRAAKCEVRHVIAGARVPIIRFLHTRSGREYECDLCFENVLATRNTPLLRAYASFDDRARAIGLAVKHWAKQRGISDASMGFLSSYSFVLLSIYYLQVVHVLPNLQDPRLLESARIRPDYYNDINIAFCEDRDIARAYHNRTFGGGPADLSLTTLLLGFFEFYATQFDFAKRVVTVRSPETPALKIGQWGSRKAKTWRMSIQDPLETGRDLGCVLQFKGQERIIQELRRAHEMLVRGKSFSDEVCFAEKSAAKPGKTGAKAKKAGTNESNKSSKQGNADTSSTNAEESQTKQRQPNKMKRSYNVTLQSADEELTKETIAALFKDFQKSFQVGKVVVASTTEYVGNDATTNNQNKRWEVELLSQAQNCPRALSLRTRLDWKASDDRVGRVWVHHHTLFATPPCRECLSPEHTTGNCPPKERDEGDDEEGAAAGDRGESQIDHKVAQRNIRRHVLRLTLGGGHSGAPSKKTDRRKKQQQHHGVPHDTHQADHKANGTSKRNNGKASRAEKKSESDRVVAVATVRRVETVEVVAAPSTSRVEGESKSVKKPTQKKKKWQQRVHRKRGSSKGESNNAAADNQRTLLFMSKKETSGAYLQAVWLIEGKGDLRFALWLLDCCYDAQNIETLKSKKAMYRVYKLFLTYQKLRRELTTNAESRPLTPKEILDEVYCVLRCIHRKPTEHSRTARKQRRHHSLVERMVEGEVVKEATRLLLMKASKAHESLLRSWLAFLRGEDNGRGRQGYTSALVYQERFDGVKYCSPSVARTSKPRHEMPWLWNSNSHQYDDTQVLDEVECFLALSSGALPNPSYSSSSYTRCN